MPSTFSESCRARPAGYCLLLLPDTAAGTRLLLLPTVAVAAACLLLRSSDSFDVFLLPSSASLFPLLFADALEPLALRFPGLLVVMVLHLSAEVAIEIVRVLSRASGQLLSAATA